MDLANGTVLPLTQVGLIPAWSPDGREVAYYAFQEGSRDVFVMSSYGRDRRAVTHTVAHEFAPSWSPDGRSLVFSAAAGAGAFRLYVSSRSGPTGSWGAPRQLAVTGAWAPRWSPDGRFIAFSRGEGEASVGSLREIVATTPDGTDERVLARVRIQQASLANWVVWSADSRSVYYLGSDESGGVSLWAVQVAGGSPRRVLSFDGDARPGQFFALHRDTVYVGIQRTLEGISLLEVVETH